MKQESNEINIRAISGRFNFQSGRLHGIRNNLKNFYDVFSQYQIPDSLIQSQYITKAREDLAEVESILEIVQTNLKHLREAKLADLKETYRKSKAYDLFP